MNIVYLGPFRFPIFDAAAARVLNNAKALKSCGHNIFVISWGGEMRNIDLCEDGKYRYHDIEYIVSNELDASGTILNRFREKYKRGRRTINILNTLEYTPDIIIMYNARFNLTLQMLRYCKGHNIKLVHDITEWFDISDMHIDDYLPNFLNMRILQKFVKNKICISSYLNRYFKHSNNIIVPATCDSEDTKWHSNILPVNSLANFNGITLIYAGSPARKDCLHLVINAVQHLFEEGADIRFVILGVEKQEYITKYGNLLSTRALNGNILFLGRVNQEDIPQYYKQSDFMVLLRKNTRKSNAGFPTKFSESIMSGVPVISNSTSDLSLYLKSGYNGFIVNGCDEGSIYEQLRDVLFLNKNDIYNLKNNTTISKKRLDYRSYISEFSIFISNLR